MPNKVSNPTTHSLSDRVRPNCEAAPWVVEEIKKLEDKLASTKENARLINEILTNYGLYDHPIVSIKKYVDNIINT
jgi:hypothetical protein